MLKPSKNVLYDIFQNCLLFKAWSLRCLVRQKSNKVSRLGSSTRTHWASMCTCLVPSPFCTWRKPRTKNSVTSGTDDTVSFCSSLLPKAGYWWRLLVRFSAEQNQELNISLFLCFLVFNFIPLIDLKMMLEKAVKRECQNISPSNDQKGATKMCSSFSPI